MKRYSILRDLRGLDLKRGISIVIIQKLQKVDKLSKKLDYVKLRIIKNF